ncbi:hypothetical protein OAI25_02065 [Alphaproteobacteria bacterium]|nr:hypothetical protein [Alphaproteobacteria bacterium]
MNQHFPKFFLHWFVLIFVFYLGLVTVQYLVIMPIETMMVEHNVALVSLFYLPHAVRVLGAWMVGPKSILALIPASLCGYFITMRPETGAFATADFIIPMIGALYAPVAFELMRFVRIDVYPKSTGVISWRTLVFAGLLSSIINSFFSTLFLEGRFPIEDTFDVLTRFVIGDVMGLVIVLFLSVGLLKAFRRFTSV